VALRFLGLPVRSKQGPEPRQLLFDLSNEPNRMRHVARVLDVVPAQALRRRIRASAQMMRVRRPTSRPERSVPNHRASQQPYR